MTCSCTSPGFPCTCQDDVRLANPIKKSVKKLLWEYSYDGGYSRWQWCSEVHDDEQKAKEAYKKIKRKSKVRRNATMNEIEVI